MSNESKLPTPQRGWIVAKIEKDNSLAGLLNSSNQYGGVTVLKVCASNLDEPVDDVNVYTTIGAGKAFTFEGEEYVFLNFEEDVLGWS